MAERTPQQQFLESLAARDFPRLTATLASDAHARMLLPKGPEEHSGRRAIVRRLEGWFGSASEFNLETSSNEPVGTRHRLSWRFNIVRNGRPREVIEQVAFLDLRHGRITRIDLLCSGFQAVSDDAVVNAEIFDAGTLGCADGLAQEFRRRIASVPFGESLAVVVSDPAAKEDLPSLARLLGQRVTSTEAQEDGRLVITVERRK